MQGLHRGYQNKILENRDGAEFRILNLSSEMPKSRARHLSFRNDHHTLMKEGS